MFLNNKPTIFQNDNNTNSKEKLLDFYLYGKPNTNQHKLVNILEASDEWLEQSHNYIQWLFPNLEPGVAYAPLMTSEIATLFAYNALLRNNLLCAYVRMLRFYGLVCTKEGTINMANNFNQRKFVWLSPNNHNHKRLTRIMKCLVLTHFYSFAQCLQLFLLALPACYVSSETKKIWQQAVL